MIENGKQPTSLKGVLSMPLKDVLVKPVKEKQSTWFDVISQQLDKEDLDWLMDCLKNKRDFSGVYIAEKLTEAGYPVSSTTINNLRKSL